jgi:hypothetical protein
MPSNLPDLLTGTEPCLVAQVPGAGDRWQQVHLNIDVARLFFGLRPGSVQSIELEKIAKNGASLGRSTRQLVFPESNKNSRIEFDFGQKRDYPEQGRPLIVVVQAEYKTYRYHTLLPGEDGHREIGDLILAGPAVGRGLRRRIVTLDDVEGYWPDARLRGGVQ